MKLFTVLARHLSIPNLVLMALVAQPVRADIRIRHDMGGELGAYMRALIVIRDSGEKVVIDGDCFSACTLITAMIPAERVCVTRRARLGFHSAKADESGRQVESPALTKTLMELYPPRIRAWLKRNGGLGRRTLILQGPALRSFYPLCD